MKQAREQKPEQAGLIFDARGKHVSQLDPVMMHLTRRRSDIPADALREIAEEVGIGVTRSTKLLLWSTLISLACVLIALVISTVRLSLGEIGVGKFARGFVPYIGVSVAMVGSWVALRTARHQKIGKAMLAHQRCPHCGYDLRGLSERTESGATTCPECGCAWRLPEVAPAEERSHVEG
jgi:predicted RNA-binding Zn-ribbon protein involved in translation (DUF1610 family)